jgi:predicted O-methyltransferase YrrM
MKAAGTGGVRSAHRDWPATWSTVRGADRMWSALSDGPSSEDDELIVPSPLTPVGKAMALLTMLPRDPAQFCDRVRAVAEVRSEPLLVGRPAYGAVEWGRALGAIVPLLGANPEDDAATLGRLRDHVNRCHAELASSAPFILNHSADIVLAELCYLTCRALRPDVVVETGVAYGITSTYILQALEQNGRGRLVSVDLPPLSRQSARFVGIVIPSSLQHRWDLRVGVSRRVLPQLLRDVGSVDLFVHDSLHTYWNMRREFELVWPRLRPGGVLIADDVQTNPAFRELERRNPAFFTVIREAAKESLLGFALK